MKNNKKNKSEGEQEEFPGYPLYPHSEDITVKAQREALDEQGSPIADAEGEDMSLDDGEELIRGESELTAEDLQALGPADGGLRMDMNEDEVLKQRREPVNFDGDELDIPGVELDDEQEGVGSEDEENNYYSLGGDRHENLEEPRE